MCRNTVLDYEIRYPAGYHTASPDRRLACRFFDTRKFSVTADTPLPPRAIRIYSSEMSYETLRRQYSPAANTAVSALERTRVDGHPAFTIRIRATTGLGAYVYVIDTGGQALILDTYEGYTSDYPRSRSVLDRMVATLRLGPGGTR